MSENPIRKRRENDPAFRVVETEYKNGIKSDPAQETAIHLGAGPCAVIAGPGSGKTFVLAERIRCLIEEKGIDPSSILVLTFSRAAAANMRRRFLQACFHPETVFGTFHSVFLRILQESSKERYRLADPAAKQQYLQHLCGLRPSFLPEKTSPEELQLLISSYKNGLSCRQKWVPELVRAYDAYMQGRGWLDFDDMILKCRELLMEKGEVLSMWRTRFRWILVDEFQDVSPSQYEVLRLLAAPCNNLFIVGDDDQSIYGFRGADPLIMQRFLSEYIEGRQDAAERTVYLATNYRCGQKILQASGILIKNNKTRIEKNFRLGCSIGGRFACRPFTDRNAEYGFLAREIWQMSPDDRRKTAIIFRTRAGARQFLQILEDRNVPVNAAAGIQRKNTVITDSREILLDLLAYCRAAEAVRGGFFRREDLLRIMNKPERFLSGSFVPEDSMSREEILAHAGYEEASLSDLLGDLGILSSLSPGYFMRYLLDAVGYRAYAVSIYKGADERLLKFSEEAFACDDLQAWRADLEEREKELQKPARDKVSSRDPGGAVKILTMHACKGLEFDNVYIPDLNEGNIPSRHAFALQQVEEERRLLYVAMTRARRSLTLSFLQGTADHPAAPSRFLQPFLAGAKP